MKLLFLNNREVVLLFKLIDALEDKEVKAKFLGVAKRLSRRPIYRVVIDFINGKFGTWKLKPWLMFVWRAVTYSLIIHFLFTLWVKFVYQIS